MSELQPLRSHELVRGINPSQSTNHPGNPEVKRYSKALMFLDIVADDQMQKVNTTSEARDIELLLLHLRSKYSVLRPETVFNQFVNWAIINGHLPTKRHNT